MATTQATTLGYHSDIEYLVAHRYWIFTDSNYLLSLQRNVTCKAPSNVRVCAAFPPILSSGICFTRKQHPFWRMRLDSQVSLSEFKCAKIQHQNSCSVLTHVALNKGAVKHVLSKSQELVARQFSKTAIGSPVKMWTTLCGPRRRLWRWCLWNYQRCELWRLGW